MSPRALARIDPRQRFLRRGMHSESSATGWVVEYFRRDLKVDKGPLSQRFSRELDAHPLLCSALSLLGFSGLVVWTFLQPDLYWEPLAFLAPSGAREALEATWQVLAVSVSLGFSGLAILMQLAAGSGPGNPSFKGALARHIHFNFSIAFGVSALIQMGLVAIWLDSDSSVIIEYFIAALSLGMMLRMYIQLASIYTSHSMADQVASEELRRLVLESRREDVAVALANAELQRAFEELMDPMPAFNTVRYRSVIPAGKVTDINISTVRRAIGTARGGEIDLNGEEATLAGAPVRRRRLNVRLERRIGQRVVSRPVFMIEQAQEVEASVRTSLEKQLLAGVRATPISETVEHALSIYLESVATSAIDAIERGDAANLTRCLALFANAVEACELDLASARGHVPETRQPPGREWDSVLRACHRVIVVAVLAQDSQIWSVADDWLTQRIFDAWHARSTEGLRDWLTISRRAMETLAESGRKDRVQRLQSHLLVLRDIHFGAVQIPTHVDDLRFQLRRSFVLLLHDSVVRSDALQAKESLDYFLASERIPYERASDVVLACLLLVAGWHDLEQSRQGPSLPELRSRIADVLVGNDLWEAVKLARDQDFQHALGAAWWEFRTEGGIGGGQVELGTYVLAVAVAGRLVPPRPDSATEQDFDLAEILVSDEARFSARPKLLTQLKALRSARLEDRFATLATSPIDPDKLAAFREAMLPALNEAWSSSFLRFFSRNDQLFSEKAEVYGSAGEEESPSGQDIPVPRYHFTSQSWIVAEPKRLARDLARTVIGHAERNALSELVADLQSSGPAHSTRDAIASLLEKAIEGKCHILGVTNDSEAFSSLLDLCMSDALGDLGGLEPFFLPIPTQPFLIGLDRQGSLGVRVHAAVSGDHGGDELPELVKVLDGNLPSGVQGEPRVLVHLAFDLSAHVIDASRCRAWKLSVDSGS